MLNADMTDMYISWDMNETDGKQMGALFSQWTWECCWLMVGLSQSKCWTSCKNMDSIWAETWVRHVFGSLLLVGSGLCKWFATSMSLWMIIDPGLWMNSASVRRIYIPVYPISSVGSSHRSPPASPWTTLGITVTMRQATPGCIAVGDTPPPRSTPVAALAIPTSIIALEYTNCKETTAIHEFHDHFLSHHWCQRHSQPFRFFQSLSVGHSPSGRPFPTRLRFPTWSRSCSRVWWICWSVCRSQAAVGLSHSSTRFAREGPWADGWDLKGPWDDHCEENLWR